MTLLTKFWEDNKGLEYPEQWGTGNTYVNHWEMPSYMLSVENPQLKGGGSELKAMIWDAAVDSVREWTGQDLTTSSLYGIRVYKEGAVLAPHVDRLPLVSSCIINVAQVCYARKSRGIAFFYKHTFLHWLFVYSIQGETFSSPAAVYSLYNLVNVLFVGMNYV